MGDPICPECRDEKHANCTGWALDDADDIVPCGCVLHVVPDE